MLQKIKNFSNLFNPRRKHRFQAAQWFGQYHLNVTDIALSKSCLTVTKIIFPHTDEGFGKFHGTHLADVAEKTFTPFLQGFYVVGCNIFKMK